MPPIDPQAPQNNPQVPPVGPPPAVPTPPTPSPIPDPTPVVSATEVSPPPPADTVEVGISPQPAVTPASVIEPVVPTPPPPPVVPPQTPVPTPQAMPSPPASTPVDPQPEPFVAAPSTELEPIIPAQPNVLASTAEYTQSPASPPIAAQVVPQAPAPPAPLTAEPAPNQVVPPLNPVLEQGQVAPIAPLNVAADLSQVPPSVQDVAAPKSRKRPLIIAGVVIAALALAGGAWALAGMPGLSKALISSSPSQDAGESGAGDASTFNPDAATSEEGGSDVATDSSSVASPVKVVFGTVSRPCFSFSLPTPNTTSKDTTCKVDAVFGNPSSNKILILPSTASFSSLESALAIAKQTYKLASPTDKKIKVGGLDAYEVTYTTTGGKKAVKIIVGTVGRNYSFGTAKVSGFEINLPANSASDQATVAELIKTWAWK